MVFQKKPENIMVMCSVFETVKLVEPLRFIKRETGNVSRAYIVHYITDTNPNSGSIYREFFNEVVTQVEKELGDRDRINEVIVEVFEFEPLLRALLCILRKEVKNGNNVFVNISGGTSEYAAAAVLACMMAKNDIGPKDGSSVIPEIRPFSVRNEISGWTVPAWKLRELYYVDGRPVGQASAVQDPVDLPTFTLPTPDQQLLLGLEVLSGHLNRVPRKSTSDRSMVTALKEKGLEKLIKDDRTTNDVGQREIMNYRRNFKSKWNEKGWIIKDDGRISGLTEQGTLMLRLFRPDLTDYLLMEGMQNVDRPVYNFLLHS